MTAKEMFEKLGYKILIPFDIDSNYIIVAYDKEMYGDSQTVYFYSSKELRIVYEDKRGNIYPPIFDLGTLEAINQQVKELGWYE